MAAVYDWNVPFTLTTPKGTLAFNQLVEVAGNPLGYFLLDQDGCESGASLRVARDDLPQTSGEIKHRHYKAGYEMHLRAQLWETIGDEGRPARRETLVAMSDLLQLHVNSIVGDNPLLGADGRIQWTPWGASVDRMLNPIRQLERPVFSLNDDQVTVVNFGVVSDRPYAWDAPETTTHIVVAQNLVNAGTAAFAPVVKVFGPFDLFTLTNTSVLDENGQPLLISYDASLPGANPVGPGHYIEIDLWRQTVYLDGDVANYKPGIDIPASDFFALEPGDNELVLAGGYAGVGADVLWQNAWA